MRSRMNPRALPFLTIVMPVRNEANHIQNTLDQLLAQDYPEDRFEIIVADGESTDRTREIVKEIAGSHPQVLLLPNPGRLPSSGRNVGFKQGKGEIFLVVDGHCFIPDDQYLKNVVAIFDRSGADCLGRPQPLDPPGLNDFQKAVALARASWIGHSGDSLIYSDYAGYVSPVSNGFAYKKEIFQKIGYVDEQFDACEDVEFNYRIEKAGLRCYMSPELTVKYYPRDSIRKLFEQMSRYGRGRYRFLKKHIETLNLNLLIPPLLVAGLLCTLILGFWGVFRYRSARFWHPLSVLLIIAGCIYGVYVMAVLIISLRLGMKKGVSFFRFLPFIFFAIHFGLGYGFIKEAIYHSTR